VKVFPAFKKYKNKSLDILNAIEVAFILKILWNPFYPNYKEKISYCQNLHRFRNILV